MMTDGERAFGVRRVDGDFEKQKWFLIGASAVANAAAAALVCVFRGLPFLFGDRRVASKERRERLALHLG